MITPVQIRITLPFAEASELLKDYIERCSQVLGFEHQADEDVSRTHSHIYLFDLPLNRPEDALRDHLFKYLKKTDYMVGKSAGKNRKGITPEGAYIYAATKEGKAPQMVKGFTDEEVGSFVEAAKRFYTPQESKAVILHTVEHKPDLVWDRFYEKLLRGDIEMREWSVDKFKRWIMVDYLNRCRPVPRAADLNRYAYSLWMLRFQVRSNPNEDTPLGVDDIVGYT